MIIRPGRDRKPTSGPPALRGEAGSARDTEPAARKSASSWERASTEWRHSRLLGQLVATVLVVAAGTAGWAFAISRPHVQRSVSARPRGDRSRQSARPACSAPALGEASLSPIAIGTWSFSMLARGVYQDLTASPPGGVLALQACGPQESVLHVVLFDRFVLRSAGGLKRSIGPSAESPGFVAAPLTSSLLSTASGVFFGDSRLAISRARITPPYQPPYRLSLVRLDPGSLQVTDSYDLGRGYGLSLAAGPDGSVLASTGLQLFELAGNGHLRLLVSLHGQVAQQLAVVEADNAALLSLFRPDAEPPHSSTELSLVNLTSGAFEATKELGARTEVESLASSGTTATVAVDDSGSSRIERFSLRFGLHRLRAGTNTAVAASLTPMSVETRGPVTWTFGSSVLACSDSTDSHVVDRTTPGDLDQDPSSIVSSGGVVYAEVPAGLGRLAAPAACER